MSGTTWKTPADKRSALPVSITQEVLRSVLYGKWCNVFGGQKELTFKTGILEKVEYHSEEGQLKNIYLYFEQD